MGYWGNGIVGDGRSPAKGGARRGKIMDCGRSQMRLPYL